MPTDFSDNERPDEPGTIFAARGVTRASLTCPGWTRVELGAHPAERRRDRGPADDVLHTTSPESELMLTLIPGPIVELRLTLLT